MLSVSTLFSKTVFFLGYLLSKIIRVAIFQPEKSATACFHGTLV